MVFTETVLPGAFLIDLERREDARGFFARVFCQREFGARGLSTTITQASIAFNRRKGSLRGLHFQYPPAAQAKLVRCSRGAICDVIVDLRPESPTYLRHVIVELTQDNHRSLYVPARCAHGYQVLEDGTEAMYHMDGDYTPEAEGGLLYSDSRLGIRWPLPVTEISGRDTAWPPLEAAEPELRRRMTIATGVGAV